jgi:hypothetical protein
MSSVLKGKDSDIQAKWNWKTKRKIRATNHLSYHSMSNGNLKSAYIIWKPHRVQLYEQNMISIGYKYVLFAYNFGGT